MSDPSPPGGPGGATLSRRAMLVAGGVTAVVAFAVGFGLAVGGSDGEGADEVVAATTTSEEPAPTVTTVAPDPTTTTAPATTSPPTTAPPATVDEAPPPPPPPPTVVVTEPPSTVAPARLVARYNQDSAERLVMSRGGTASLTITNVGGSLASWLVQASGYVYLDGVSSGTLQPGQSVAVRLRGAPDVPPMAPQGHVTITGGADGQLTIAVLVL